MWSRYEVRGFVQACRIREHAVTHQHRRALAMLRNPSSVAGAQDLEVDHGDGETEELFAKAVPQLEDWMVAWSAYRTNQSWLSSVANARLFNNGSFTRAGHHGTRESLRSLVQIMREVARERKRVWIAESQVVNLAFDDRKSYTLVRFSCDIGLASPQACSELGARHGLLGVIDGTLGMTEEDYDADYAERTVEKMRKVVRLFYTKIDGRLSVGEDEIQRFWPKVRLVAADMGLMKCVEYMKGSIFPRLIIYHRDPAHALRLAIKDPLERVERFEAIFDILFHKQHALLKDLRFSDLWRGKLIEWQERLVRDRGYQGGAITEIIRNFSFAPQRFESFYTPLFNLLLILPAVIWMLKQIAEDWRDDDAKFRAMRALNAIDAQFVLDLGLICDYAAVSLRLLRRFDVHSKDPSVTLRLLKEWLDQLHTLFRDGNVFQVVPSIAAGLDDSETIVWETPMTGTQIAMEQITYIGEVDYANHIRDFCNKRPTDLFEDGMRRMNQVIDAVEARVWADFSDSDLYMCLEIFDLDAWSPLLPLASSQSISSTDAGLRLGRKLRAYLDFFSLEYKTVDHWVLVAAIAVRHKNSIGSECPQRSPTFRLDHRICWALAAQEIARCHPWADVPVRGYLAWIDGTGSVERGLGIHAAVQASHQGTKTKAATQDELEMCAELRIDGPADSTEISYRDRYGQEHVGRFGKDCAAKWLATRGRRFGTYKKRKDAGCSRPVRKTGTFKKQRALQVRALDSISSLRAYPWLRGCSKERMAEVRAGIRLSQETSTLKLDNYIKNTQERAHEKKEAGIWRGFPVKPTEPRRKATQRASPPSLVAGGATVEPLCAITNVVGVDKRFRYKAMTGVTLQSARAFKVESVRDLDFGDTCPHKFSVWLHVIALGKAVVASKDSIGKTRQFLPAIELVWSKVYVTPAFRKKHEQFFRLFSSLLLTSGCRWKSIDNDEEKEVIVIKNTQDVRLFLLQVQRVPSNSQSFSQRAKPPRPI